MNRLKLSFTLCYEFFLKIEEFNQIFSIDERIEELNKLQNKFCKNSKSMDDFICVVKKHIERVGFTIFSETLKEEIEEYGSPENVNFMEILGINDMAKFRQTKFYKKWHMEAMKELSSAKGSLSKKGEEMLLKNPVELLRTIKKSIEVRIREEMT